MSLIPHAQDLIRSHDHTLTDIEPSAWAEERRVMSKDVSSFPGRWTYERTPYTREIIDCLSQNHPARIVAIMKGAQIGISAGVIENGIGYIIEQQPSNIMFLSGDAELSTEAMTGKIDQMIESCGLRHLIRPNIVSKRNVRTGDTATSKEFPGGRLFSGSTMAFNKFGRQRSICYGFIDDFEVAPKSDEKAGSITSLIEQRFAAFYPRMKLFYISTPELKQSSNIEPVYLLGDQRRFFVPCPKCGEHIVLEWNIEIDGKENAGVSWKLDDRGKYLEGSAGYVCQNCANFYHIDRFKYEMNLAGEWRPTAEPSEANYFSYHISSLYAPPGMYNIEYYVRQFIKAYPQGGKPNIGQLKTFYNVVLGKPWEDRGTSPKATELSKWTRDYQIDELPESLSLEDGNGLIMLVTAAADLNGKNEDARLDWEVTAWTENGASYSIAHGSIGTFIPNEAKKKVKVDREHWTYRHGQARSVWPLFEEIMQKQFKTDTGRAMSIFMAGIDTGHYTAEAYEYIDKTNFPVVGLKGADDSKMRKYGVDTPVFKFAKERAKLYILEVNQLKDELAQRMGLKWINEDGTTPQPAGFMNFPQPADGLYTMNSFFSHFESEHRIAETNRAGEYIGSRWVKKSSAAQNHFWDVHLYNMAIKEILTYAVCKAEKITRPNWKSYCEIIRKAAGL